jgi:hypothetical protein
LVVAASPAAAATPLGAYTTKGTYSFVSTPNLHPPKIRETLHTQASKLGSGLFLMGNFRDLTQSAPMIGQSGPLILDNKLQPVWFQPSDAKHSSLLAADLTVQTYNGKPALAWWDGTISPTGATISGTVHVVDQHYRKIADLSGDTKDGWVISPHESVISGHNVFVTAYKNLPKDLSSFGGLPNGVLTDSAVQEYDLRTGKLLFTWSAFNPGGTPHIPLSQSQAHPAPVLVQGHVIPWDAYHINSIQLFGTHSFLVSMRNTWGAYLVDMSTGNVIWTLSGKGPAGGGTFTLPANAGFEWQHMVRLLPHNRVSLFDDACCPNVGGVFKNPSGPSRGLVLQLDTAHNTASLVAGYPRAQNFDAAFLGSMELLSNGNALVGWGSQPFFSVYSKSGKLLMDAALPAPNLSYRVLLQNWVGTPSYPPAGAVKKNHGRSTVYASWNGATQVASWRVLAGKDGSHLSLVATRSRTGFETSVSFPHTYTAYKVVALDGKGKVLGRSHVFPTPAPQFGGY